MFHRLIGILGSIASVVSIALVESLLQWQQFVLFIAGLTIIYSIFYEVKEYRKLNPKKLKTNKEIRDYLYKFIKEGSKTVIYTRDMSWADDDEIKLMLSSKAKKGELDICLPKRITLVDELERIGANVYVYGDIDPEITPSSRFTIIYADSDNARLTIGRKTKENRHINLEFEQRDHCYTIASDLVKIIRKISKFIDEGNKNKLNSDNCSLEVVPAVTPSEGIRQVV